MGDLASIFIRFKVVQWNLRNMDTLQKYQSVQFSLCILKGYFGTSTKCVDYADILIFKCPH